MYTGLCDDDMLIEEVKRGCEETGADELSLYEVSVFNGKPHITPNCLSYEDVREMCDAEFALKIIDMHFHFGDFQMTMNAAGEMYVRSLVLNEVVH